MPSLHTFLSFTLVSVVITLLPGPSNFFLVFQGALHGRGRALACVAGIETASAIRVLATAAGLSALLASSAVAFSAVRWTGVAYLVILGLRAIPASRAGAAQRSTAAPPDDGTSIRAMRKGLLVGLGNVKMAIFYLAFFPQFIHPDRGPQLEQILVLGALFWVIGLSGDLLYAVASAAAGRWLRARPHLRSAQARTEAVIYLALAAWTAVGA